MQVSYCRQIHVTPRMTFQLGGVSCWPIRKGPVLVSAEILLQGWQLTRTYNTIDSSAPSPNFVREVARGVVRVTYIRTQLDWDKMRPSDIVILMARFDRLSERPTTRACSCSLSIVLSFFLLGKLHQLSAPTKRNHARRASTQPLEKQQVLPSISVLELHDTETAYGVSFSLVSAWQQTHLCFLFWLSLIFYLSVIRLVPSLFFLGGL